ncbi:Rv0361 family membrane protein [Nocardia sp. R16R-3T]
MTYPQGGQTPFGQPQYPQGAGQPQQGYGYPQQGGYPPPSGQGYGPQQGYPPPKRRTGLIIALLVLVLVIAGAVAAGVVLMAQGKTPLASDEKKIQVAIHDFYDTLGKSGFAAAAAKACAADRADFDTLTEEQKKEFDSAKVEVDIDKIDDIVIIGDRATAKITGKLTLTVPGETPDTDTGTTEHLRKEDGKWKVCSAESGKN